MSFWTGEICVRSKPSSGICGSVSRQRVDIRWVQSTFLYWDPQSWFSWFSCQGLWCCFSPASWKDYTRLTLLFRYSHCWRQAITWNEFALFLQESLLESLLETQDSLFTWFGWPKFIGRYCFIHIFSIYWILNFTLNRIVILLNIFFFCCRRYFLVSTHFISLVFTITIWTLQDFSLVLFVPFFEICQICTLSFVCYFIVCT